VAVSMPIKSASSAAPQPAIANTPAQTQEHRIVRECLAGRGPTPGALPFGKRPQR
jgi:hypothetical protein